MTTTDPAAAPDWPAWPRDDWWPPEHIGLSDGARLACRVREGADRPVILVHGLASNALLWRQVAEALADTGHAVAAADLRSHGRSDQTPDGHDTSQAARDLVEVVDHLGWHDRGPLLVGQSWGGNVVLRSLSEGGGFAGGCCVDGGWIQLASRFPSFDECWKALAPPGFGSSTPDQVLERLAGVFQGWPPNAVPAVAGNLRIEADRVLNRLPADQHRSIVHSLWRDDPADTYLQIAVPVHLMVAGRTSSQDVDRAAAAMSDASVSWHPEAHHDIHLQRPELVLEQVGELMRRVKGSVR